MFSYNSLCFGPPPSGRGHVGRVKDLNNGKLDFITRTNGCVIGQKSRVAHLCLVGSYFAT